MRARAQHIVFTDRKKIFTVILSEKLGNKLKGLGVTDYFSSRVFFHKRSNIGGMVGFHVLNNKVIRRSAAEYFIEIVKPFLAEFCLDRIEYRYFFIKNDIGIIRHSLGNFILSFKK